MRTIFILSAAILLLAGCSGPRPLTGTTGGLSVVQGDAMPPPERGDMTASDRPYLIGPFDRLSIDVFGIDELKDRKVQIDASGRLSFPLVGVLEVSGKTPGELAAILQDRLSDGYIKNPQVTVNLEETVSQVITVDGEVREPGLYPVVGRMTLMRAVARAKGLTEFARQNDIVVFRTVEGKKLAALYNLEAIRRGNYSDPEVFANDVIVVGDSKARRLFKDILTAAPLLTAPLIIALQ